MTSNSIERKTFNKYRAAMIRELGRKATEGSDLNRIGHREFGPFWNGIHPSDRVKLEPHKFYIVNTDKHDKPGQHWIACYVSKDHVYLWDSYGRPVRLLIHPLIDNIEKHGYILGKTDLVHHSEQIGYESQVCGQDSCAWLLTVRDLGIQRARNI